MCYSVIVYLFVACHCQAGRVQDKPECNVVGKHPFKWLICMLKRWEIRCCYVSEAGTPPKLLQYLRCCLYEASLDIRHVFLPGSGHVQGA